MTKPREEQLKLPRFAVRRNEMGHWVVFDRECPNDPPSYCGSRDKARTLATEKNRARNVENRESNEKNA